MKGEEPLLDRAGVYTQLQQLLTPGSSNSVLDQLPPETRAVWQSLGAAAAATAAKHARAGDAAEVQQEMALQKLQQLLETAVAGQEVALEPQEEAENKRLLVNRIVPQVLAHKPFSEERDLQGEEVCRYLVSFGGCLAVFDLCRAAVVTRDTETAEVK